MKDTEAGETEDAPTVKVTVISAPPPRPERPWWRVPQKVVSSSWFLGALVTLLAAPDWIRYPSPGLDPSWQAAIHMAAREGRDFGSQIDFTYGPLGFLALPNLYFPSTAVLALAFTFAARAALCAALLRVGRRSFGLLLALPCVYVAARLLKYVDFSQAVPLLALVVCLDLLARDDLEEWEASRRLVSFFAAAGAAAGLLLLVKFNAGATSLVVVAVAAVLAPTRRRNRVLTVAAAGGGTLAAIVLGWLVTGNQLGDLVLWFRTSLSVASGYSTAMGVEGEHTHLHLVPWVVGIIGVAVVAGAWRWPAKRRVAVVLVVGAFGFAAFKHGFVRHDLHELGFFGVMPALLLGLGLKGKAWVAAFVPLVVIEALVSPFAVADTFDPRPSLEQAQDVFEDLTSASRRAEAIDTARAGQQATYALDPATLAALAGGDVHVSPTEASVLWAYPQLEWDPLPIFQEYSAYTHELDQLNADALEDADGPARVLRETARAIDGRNPDFESPEAQLALLCNFVQVSATDRWQVLARAPDRCGAPRTLTRVRVDMGQVVRVPAPTSATPAIVAVRIHGLTDGLATKLLSFLYKPHETFMSTDDGSRLRLVPETVEGPLLMTVPDQIGYAPAFGFTRDVKTFRLFQERGPAFAAVDHVTVEFVEVPLVG